MERKPMIPRGGVLILNRLEWHDNLLLYIKIMSFNSDLVQYVAKFSEREVTRSWISFDIGDEY